MTDTAQLTLTEFLTARLDEDEAVARAVVPLGYSVDMGGKRNDEHFTHGRTGYASEDGMSRRLPDGGAAAHFARHDPARVLREVEAKRRIVKALFVTDLVAFQEGLTTSVWDGPRSKAILYPNCLEALREMAAVYSDHPDYRDEWRA